MLPSYHVTRWLQELPHVTSWQRDVHPEPCCYLLATRSTTNTLFIRGLHDLLRVHLEPGVKATTWCLSHPPCAWSNVLQHFNIGFRRGMNLMACESENLMRRGFGIRHHVLEWSSIMSNWSFHWAVYVPLRRAFCTSPELWDYCSLSELFFCWKHPH